MTPTERRHLQAIDDLILKASPDELKRIQRVDYQTQMDGISFYDVYVDSDSLISHNIKESFGK